MALTPLSNYFSRLAEEEPTFTLNNKLKLIDKPTQPYLISKQHAFVGPERTIPLSLEGIAATEWDKKLRSTQHTAAKTIQEADARYREHEKYWSKSDFGKWRQRRKYLPTLFNERDETEIVLTELSDALLTNAFAKRVHDHTQDVLPQLEQSPAYTQHIQGLVWITDAAKDLKFSTSTLIGSYEALARDLGLMRHGTLDELKEVYRTGKKAGRIEERRNTEQEQLSA